MFYTLMCSLPVEGYKWRGVTYKQLAPATLCWHSELFSDCYIDAKMFLSIFITKFDLLFLLTPIHPNSSVTCLWDYRTFNVFCCFFPVLGLK